jgi:hypothetical protein
MIMKVIRPAFDYLRVLMINDDVGDGVLTEFEDGGIDERVGEEVVPAPSEHLLDGDRKVGVGDIEEWTWVR